MVEVGLCDLVGREGEDVVAAAHDALDGEAGRSDVHPHVPVASLVSVVFVCAPDGVPECSRGVRDVGCGLEGASADLEEERALEGGEAVGPVADLVDEELDALETGERGGKGDEVVLGPVLEDSVVLARGGPTRSPTTTTAARRGLRSSETSKSESCRPCSSTVPSSSTVVSLPLEVKEVRHVDGMQVVGEA